MEKDQKSVNTAGSLFIGKVGRFIQIGKSESFVPKIALLAVRSVYMARTILGTTQNLVKKRAALGNMRNGSKLYSREIELHADIVGLLAFKCMRTTSTHGLSFLNSGLMSKMDSPYVIDAI